MVVDDSTDTARQRLLFSLYNGASDDIQVQPAGGSCCLGITWPVRFSANSCKLATAAI